MAVKGVIKSGKEGNFPLGKLLPFPCPFLSSSAYSQSLLPNSEGKACTQMSQNRQCPLRTQAKEPREHVTVTPMVSSDPVTCGK